MKQWLKIYTAGLYLVTVLSAQPTSVSIISPLEHASALTNPVNFTWSTSPLALAYTIQLSTDNLFAVLSVNQSTQDTVISIPDLSMSMKYYWRVRAENIDGASAWTIGVFTTKLNVPSLVNPVSGSTNIRLNPTLRWSESVVSAGYRVELSLQPDFSSIVRTIDTDSTNSTLDSLERATTYYWRVRASVNGDTTAYSNSNHFRTIPKAPAAPNLLLPENISVNNAVNVVLRWSSIDNATSYTLHVSMSPIFSSVLLDSTISDTLYRSKSYFKPNTQYFWRVNAVNAVGKGSYSGTYRFTTGRDTNTTKLSFQHIDLGTFNSGLKDDIVLSLDNTGTDDLVIDSIATSLPGNWVSFRSIPSNWITALAVRRTNLFAGTDSGIYHSTNNGSIWSDANNGLTNRSIRSIVFNGASIFAGTNGGIFLSTNNGTSWMTINTGLTNKSVRALAFSNNNLFAGTDGGIFLSTNNGTTWTAVNTGLTNTSIRAFAFRGTNLFVGTNGGVFLSTSNGSNWMAINFNLTNRSVRALAFCDTNLFAGTDGGAYILDNTEMNWSSVLTGTPVYAFAVSGKNIIAGTYTSVVLSPDNGSHWKTVTDGIAQMRVSSLLVNGTNLFAGTSGNYLYRADYLDLSPANSKYTIRPGTFCSVPVHFNSVPAGTVTGRIIIVSNARSSPDTVAITGFGASYDLSVQSTVIDFGNVEIGQTKDTVLILTNIGNQPLEISNVMSTSSLFTATSLYFDIPIGGTKKDTIRFTAAGTGQVNEKIFISNKSLIFDSVTVRANGVTTDAKKNMNIPEEYSLSQNYPNPFNPSTTIRYSVPMTSRISIILYSMIGQQVAVIVNGGKEPGYYECSFNASHLSTGVYFYRIEARSELNQGVPYMETRKMILMK